MEENLNEIQESEKRGGFRPWFENFWYHYKWHSIITVFVIFVVTVCTIQMCKKEDRDLYVLYGGSKIISTQVENGNFCEFDVISSSLKEITNDYDENGQISPIFYSVYLLSDAEIKAAGGDVDQALLYRNNQEFRDLMMSSSFYICFLSKDLYLEYAKTEGVFCPIAPYTGGAELDYLDAGAVYLHSKNLPFNTLPGINLLPDDTVICLRAKTAFSGGGMGKEAKKQFERSEESLREIFSYGR
jgi:hypothetical protein